MKVIKEWKFNPTDDMTVPQYHEYRKWVEKFANDKIRHYFNQKTWQSNDLYYSFKITPPPKEIEKFFEFKCTEIPDKPKDLPWYKKLI
jgi:hypothetical protein